MELEKANGHLPVGPAALSQASEGLVDVEGKMATVWGMLEGFP